MTIIILRVFMEKLPLGGGGIRRLTVLLCIETVLENYKRHLNFQIRLLQDFNPPRQTRLQWFLRT